MLGIGLGLMSRRSRPQRFGRFPGASGAGFTSPDSVASSIVGDGDWRCFLAPSDWTPASFSYPLSKWLATGVGPNSYIFGIESDGKLELAWSTTGSDTVLRQSTAVVPFIDSHLGWIRATLDVDNGSAGHTVTFYTSLNGFDWTVLGVPVVTAGITSIFDSTAALNVGGFNNLAGGYFPGQVNKAQIRNGIGGAVVVNFDPSDWISGNTWTSKQTGEVWTRQGAAVIS